MNVPGSAQPATARCVARLPHQRTPSFIPAILRQGCVPQGAHPHRPPSQRHGQGLAARCHLSPDGGGGWAGRGFQAPQTPPNSQTGHQGGDAGGWHDATVRRNAATPVLLPIGFLELSSALSPRVPLVGTYFSCSRDQRGSCALTVRACRWRCWSLGRSPEKGYCNC